MCQAAVQFMHNLGKDSNLHTSLMEQGLMTLLLSVASPSSVPSGDIGRVLPPKSPGSNKITEINENLTTTDVYNIVRAVDLVSQTPSCREKIVSERAVAIFSGLLGSLDDNSRFEMARSIASLALTKSCREALVSQGAPQLLISLSNTENVATKEQCSLALGCLSELTTVKSGTVASMLAISEHSSLHYEKEREKSLQSPIHRRSSQEDGTHPQPPQASMCSPPPSKSSKGMASDEVPSEPVLKKVTQALIGFKYNLEKVKEHTSRQELIRIRRLEQPKDEDLTINDESSLLYFDFDAYCYSVTTHQTSLESGGVAKKLKLNPYLPSIAKERNNEPPDRVHELTQVPINMQCLVKEQAAYFITDTFANNDLKSSFSANSAAPAERVGVTSSAKDITHHHHHHHHHHSQHNKTKSHPGGSNKSNNNERMPLGDVTNRSRSPQSSVPSTPLLQVGSTKKHYETPSQKKNAVSISN